MKAEEMEFKKILVPVDFSSHCKLAVKYAVAIARKFGGKLFLLYVSYDPEPALSRVHIPNYEEFRQNLLEKAAEDLADFIPPDLRKGLEAEEIVVEGVPHDEIVRQARNKEVDLIVMATHGRTGLSHVLMGSVTEKVLRHAPCPVLAIRNPQGKFKEEWD